MVAVGMAAPAAMSHGGPLTVGSRAHRRPSCLERLPYFTPCGSPSPHSTQCLPVMAPEEGERADPLWSVIPIPSVLGIMRCGRSLRASYDLRRTWWRLADNLAADDHNTLPSRVWFLALALLFLKRRKLCECLSSRRDEWQFCGGLRACLVAGVALKRDAAVLDHRASVGRTSSAKFGIGLLGL